MPEIKILDLKVEIDFKLHTANAGYSDAKEVATIKKEMLLTVNTDSPKRKIVSQVEDVIEDLVQELYRSIQASQKLTDGEIGKAEKDKENNF